VSGFCNFPFSNTYISPSASTFSKFSFLEVCGSVFCLSFRGVCPAHLILLDLIILTVSGNEYHLWNGSCNFSWLHILINKERRKEDRREGEGFLFLTYLLKSWDLPRDFLFSYTFSCIHYLVCDIEFHTHMKQRVRSWFCVL